MKIVYSTKEDKYNTNEWEEIKKKNIFQVKRKEIATNSAII